MQAQIPDGKDFSSLIDGKRVDLFTLTGKDRSMQCAITNYGARLVSLILADKAGNHIDVALGYSSLQDYIEGPEDYMGAIVGRCANRIANGHFTLHGQDYYLPKNNGQNTLHGGLKGLHARVWDVAEVAEDSITLHYLSPNGEEGFPGALDITVTYRLEGSSTLIVEYKATTDAATPVNLSNHTYWNLSGEGTDTIEDHSLQLIANQYTPVDAELIPTGEVLPVGGTPFYFCTSQVIGARLRDRHDQLLYGKGYDHNWVLEGSNIAAVVRSPISGITMELITDQPGMQFYSGNFLDGSRTGKRGKPYPFRSAFVLEPQHFPDSVNKPNFPPMTLEPSQIYSSLSSYFFDAH